MLEQPKKKLLYEVSVIRPIVISLLVFLHSFTKISNGGGYSNEYQLNSIYEWLCAFIIGFRIETIALIAGYVFAFQSIDLHRKYMFIPFVSKKFKRLIIPMLFFGCIYYFLFFFNPAMFNIGSFFISLLSGCGHLWFLPMLFWCFLAIWIIDQFKLSGWVTLLLLAAMAIMPVPSLPFGLARLPHFLFFVYAGYFLWEKREWLLDKALGNKTICGLWLLYVIMVIVTRVLLPESSAEMSMFSKGIIYLTNSGLKLFMSCCGIMALYLLVCKFTTRENYKAKDWVITASDNCYGLYVFHQFVLVLLYFKTPFVNNLHPLLVPWLGFIIIYVVSLCLTKLSLKTKLGRFLIG